MNERAVRLAIERTLEVGDLSYLDDYLAEDVELRVGFGVGTSISACRGKRVVASRLAQAADEIMPAVPEFAATGERVVALCDERVPLRSGLAMNVQSALVLDIENGLITRLAIHHDIAPSHASVERAGPSRVIDGPFAETKELVGSFRVTA